jgi:hypothetical protein
MSDLGLQPRDVWKQPDRLPAEETLGCSENTSKPRRCFLGAACLALFAYVPLLWHSGSSILILILTVRPAGHKKQKGFNYTKNLLSYRTTTTEDMFWPAAF